jgi:WD40 repeat protein
VAVAAQKHASSTLAREALSTAAAEPVSGVFGPLPRTTSTDAHPIAISFDGRHVATTDGRSRVAVWDVEHHRDPLVLHEAGTIGITSLSFSPDGRKLAVAYQRPPPRDTDVLYTAGLNVVWNLDHGTRMAVWKQKYDYMESLAFAPDGVTVAAGGSSGELEVWDTRANTQRSLASTSGLAPPVHDVTVSPDGRWYAAAVGGLAGNENGGAVAIGVTQGNVVLWDASTGGVGKILPVGGWDVYAGAFSPDGNSFVTGDQLGRVELWNVNTGALASTWNDESPVSFLAFDRSGSVVVSGDDNGAVLARDAHTGEVGATWSDGAAVTGVAFSSRGHTVVTGDEQGRAVLRDTRLLFTGTKFDQPVLRLAFADDDSTLTALTVPLTENQQSTVARWDASDDPMPLGGDERTNAMAASADGRLLVTIQGQPTATGLASDVIVSNARDGAMLHTWSVDDLVSDVALSPDGKRVVLSETSLNGDTGTLTVRDTATGRVVRSVAKSPFFGQLSISQPAPQTAVGSHADAVATINIQHLSVAGPNRRLERVDHAPQGDQDSTVVSSADGRTLAVIHVSTAQTRQVELLRRWATTTPRTTVVPDSGLQPNVVALSRDGRYLAIGDTHRGVQVWEVGRGGNPVDPPKVVTSWRTNSAVTSLAFSPDGRRLAAGDASGHVQYWDLTAQVEPSSVLVSRVCHMLRGYEPPQAEWKQVVPYVQYADLCK